MLSAIRKANQRARRSQSPHLPLLGIGIPRGTAAGTPILAMLVGPTTLPVPGMVRVARPWGAACAPPLRQSTAVTWGMAARPCPMRAEPRTTRPAPCTEGASVFPWALSAPGPLLGTMKPRSVVPLRGSLPPNGLMTKTSQFARSDNHLRSPVPLALCPCILRPFLRVNAVVLS